MAAYYNEFDPYAAQWLKNLIAAGHIADGEVDTRSIEDVRPEEIREFTQCHFFAGIGVWSYALRRAGWPDDRPVWTGSCPCQPFSSAGKGAGFDDERHLWPAFHHLIQSCQPPVVFGEQVASRDGRDWLSLVHADLEALGYSFGAADLCAAGVGAPHIRQRLYWCGVVNAEGEQVGLPRFARKSGSPVDGLAQPDQGERRQGWAGPGEAGRPHAEPSGRGEAGQLALPQSVRRPEGDPQLRGLDARTGTERPDGRATGSAAGSWSDCDWLPCRDGKARPVEPGTFPLAHGASSRVGRLRAYGNAIVPQVAEAFIRSFNEAVVLHRMLQ